MITQFSWGSWLFLFISVLHPIASHHHSNRCCCGTLQTLPSGTLPPNSAVNWLHHCTLPVSMHLYTKIAPISLMLSETSVKGLSTNTLEVWVKYYNYGCNISLKHACKHGPCLMQKKRKAPSRFEFFLFHLCEFALPTVVRKMWPHTVWVVCMVRNLLPFEHQPKAVSWGLGDLWHNQLLW